MGCHTPESENWALEGASSSGDMVNKGHLPISLHLLVGVPSDLQPLEDPIRLVPGNSLGPGASIPLSAVKWLWRAGLGLGWKSYRTFSGGSDGKEFACNAGDVGSIPGSGRSPGEGDDNPLQYSCLENFTDSP